MRVRVATNADVEPLAALLRRYMRESFGRAWGGTTGQLRADLSHAGPVSAVIAEHEGTLVGFAFWTPAYDVHHCVAGGAVTDLYVAPEWRALGSTAFGLVSRVCAEVRGRGGRYVIGETSGSRMAIAGLRVGHGSSVTEITVSGRAFRTLAELSGCPVREVTSGLPEQAWNYEP